MTVTAAQILTAETVPQYLQDRWESEGIGNTLGATGSVEESLEGVEVQAIQGGNVNYAFCIRLPSIDKVVFLKQAPEFVAVFGPDGFPLTSERMQREMDVYSEWKGLLGDDLGKKYLPEIYYFDSEWFYFVFPLLRFVLFRVAEEEKKIRRL